ncbi:MAG: hypothetical protein WC824_02350 [Bacteroidota bacterium]|jgi:hypothetical protein
MTLRTTVTDMLGRTVAELHEDPMVSATHDIIWNGTNLGKEALKP